MAEHRATSEFTQDGTFKDLPGIESEKQTLVDEDAINESFEPATDAFSGFREFSDWLFGSISDLLQSVFGNLM
jgi:hypothetical protein